MKIINVTNQMYTIPDVQTQSLENGVWSPTKPYLLRPNLKEKFVHWLGIHFSFGQSYCVVCGKKENKPLTPQGGNEDGK